MNKKQIQEALRKSLREMEVLRQKYVGKDAPAWDPSDEKAFEDLVTESEKLEKQLEIVERAEAVEKRLSASNDNPPAPTPAGEVDQKAAYHQWKRAMGTILKGRALGDPGLVASGAEMLHTANKDLQVDRPQTGGFLVSPMQFIGELIQNVHDLVFVRQLAGRTIPLGRNETIGIPVLESHIADADWTPEIGSINADTQMAFGRREMKPNQMTKLVKESRYLMARDSIDVMDIVREDLAYKFAITEEKAFMTGNGSSQPLGIFTPDANGIPASQDVSTGTAAYVVADDLIATKFNVKQQYWDKGVWVISRPMLSCIRRLKDANGNYIWATGFGPGLGFQGRAETLLDSAYCVSEYAPTGAGSTDTTAPVMGTGANAAKISLASGHYCALFGDFRSYWIVDAEELEIQVLTELFALTSEVGVIGQRWTDGAPVRQEAFSRLITS